MKNVQSSVTMHTSMKAIERVYNNVKPMMRLLEGKVLCSVCVTLWLQTVASHLWIYIFITVHFHLSVIVHLEEKTVIRKICYLQHSCAGLRICKKRSKIQNVLQITWTPCYFTVSRSAANYHYIGSHYWNDYK